MTRRSFVIMRCATATIVVLLMAAVTSAQGLGEAAAREKARREKAGESGRAARTVTDEDLKTGVKDGTQSAGTYSPAAGTVGTAATGANASKEQSGARSTPGSRQTAPADTARNDEEHWRRRVGTARARVAQAEKNGEEMEKLHLVEGERYVDAKTGATVVANLTELRALTAKAKAEREVARQALSDLEEEARRGGVPPGWLR
jgi:hypothetical protein